MSTDSTRRRTGWLSAMALTIGLFVSACSSGPSANDLAEEACDLARRLATNQAGLVGAGLEANDLRKKARDNDISLSDVLSAARGVCPDVVDGLPL